MRTVLLLEPVLAHYRKDLYEHFLSCNHFKFKIVGGKNYLGIQSFDDERFIKLNYLSFRLYKQNFYHLKDAIKYVLNNKPDIVICSGVDFHHIYTIVLYFIYRIILRKEFYWWSHATFGNQGKFGRWIRKLFYRSASGVFVYSRKGKENLLTMGVKGNKIQIINNAINYEDYGYLNKAIIDLESSHEIFTILFSGRINKERKLDVLIRALGIIKEKDQFQFKCYIIGSGDIEPIKNLSKELNISDKIVFTGPKYGKEIFPYFLESDIFVYPGGIGLALLHALSFGLPVITTDNYSIQMPEIELLIPGKNGDLYKNASPEVLAEKIAVWKEKISVSKEEVRKSCVDIIDEMGYMPDKVGDAVINYLRKRYMV
jgi:glycosyltransferase involved in cell wall biosynthesis